MLHHDPTTASWPTHPERHIQLEAGDGLPPFADWRIPADGDPFRWLEYLIAMLTLAPAADAD